MIKKSVVCQASTALSLTSESEQNITGFDCAQPDVPLSLTYRSS